MDTPQPGRTCFDNTPSPTPFPYTRPHMGEVKFYRQDGHFTESSELDANVVRYTGNEHVCFKSKFVLWNYLWALFATIAAAVIIRRTISKVLNIKRKKFVMYPMNMDEWKIMPNDRRLSVGLDSRINPTIK